MSLCRHWTHTSGAVSFISPYSCPTRRAKRVEAGCSHPLDHLLAFSSFTGSFLQMLRSQNNFNHVMTICFNALLKVRLDRVSRVLNLRLVSLSSSCVGLARPPVGPPVARLSSHSDSIQLFLMFPTCLVLGLHSGAKLCDVYIFTPTVNYDRARWFTCDDLIVQKHCDSAESKHGVYELICCRSANMDGRHKH